MDASIEEWPTSSETTIIYLQMMYKTPIFAEPQQYNRPFSTFQLSAFIIQLVLWDVATPQVNEKFKVEPR
jgi:hypothetical protein